jgi:molybdopterin-guanine dinucleotide biosynthesis protein MobB
LGKTKLIEKFAYALHRCGYRLATLKYMPHGRVTGQEEQNSQRYLRAGSEVAGVRTEDCLYLQIGATKQVDLAERVYHPSEECDLIIAEGFKHGMVSKIRNSQYDWALIFAVVFVKLFWPWSPASRAPKTQLSWRFTSEGCVEKRPRLSYRIKKAIITKGSFVVI